MGCVESCTIRANALVMECQAEPRDRDPKASFGKNTRVCFMNVMVYMASIHLAWERCPQERWPVKRRDGSRVPHCPRRGGGSWRLGGTLAGPTRQSFVSKYMLNILNTVAANLDIPLTVIPFLQRV